MKLKHSIRYCVKAVLVMTFVLTCTEGFAQQQALDSLIKKFDNYRTVSTSEKIYVHLNQDAVLTGETLWFKLYLINSSTHNPMFLSKVAYVEVLDAVNHAVLQTKISMQDGYGSGSLFIPASITSGYYTVRAYTNWMKNFGSDFYFHKRISIINPFRKLDVDKKKTISKLDVQFFPEGGNLIKGIKSTVAFRITNLPASHSGMRLIITSPELDSLTTFVDSLGMGSFEITPQTQESYSAILEQQPGQSITLKLPSPLESGYVLNIKDSTQDALAVNIRSTPSQGSNPTVYLIIHARNIIESASIHYLKPGTTTVMISKKIMQEGISHITLFNAQMKPVCERLYFNPVKRLLFVEAVASQAEYGVRRKVLLDLQSMDANKSPVSANLSISVYKSDSIQNNNGPSILNYIWLTSDLPEVPDLPADFFEDIDSKKKILLDNIMLTHGWRRFNWSAISGGNTQAISFMPEYRGHIIKGKVTDADGKPTGAIVTYLSAPGSNVQIYGSTSNLNGDIQFEMKDFSGQRRIVVQTNVTKDSTSRIEILSPFSDKFSKQTLPLFILNNKLEQQLSSRSLGMQVQDIFYQDKGAQSRRTLIDTTAFYGNSDETYYLDDYTRFPVMEEVMREYVPGVLVRKRKDGFHFINLDIINKGVFDQDPLILLDGLAVFDTDKIMAFDPLKVKKLEVVTRRYYTGVLSLPGVVSYTTYAGDLAGFTLDPRSVVMDYEGLQLQREFYAPKYATSKQRESRLPDQRNALFWAPFIETGPDGKQHIEFYTSDVIGKYNVVIEGMTREGLAGDGATTFSVRPFDN